MIDSYAFRFGDSFAGVLYTVSARGSVIDPLFSLIAQSYYRFEEFGGSWNEHWLSTIRDLHNLLVERGDRDELRRQFSNDPIGWYMAQAGVFLTRMTNRSLEYIQLGRTYAGVLTPRGIQRIAPIHSIADEVASRTIEESCLSPFATRTQDEIARQLIPYDSSASDSLAHLDADSFATAIGTADSRILGYFPDPSARSIGNYRRTMPQPDYGVVHIDNDALLVCFLAAYAKSQASLPKSCTYTALTKLRVWSDGENNPLAVTRVAKEQAISLSIHTNGTLRPLTLHAPFEGAS